MCFLLYFEKYFKFFSKKVSHFSVRIRNIGRSISTDMLSLCKYEALLRR